MAAVQVGLALMQHATGMEHLIQTMHRWPPVTPTRLAMHEAPNPDRAGADPTTLLEITDIFYIYIYINMSHAASELETPGHNDGRDGRVSIASC
jgi:hypothetical protein